jgi:hypothetical protein
MPCSLLDVYRRFGGTHCLFRVENKPRKQKAINKPTESLFGLLIHPEDGAITLSETINFYQTMRRHMPKDDTVYLSIYLSVCLFVCLWLYSPLLDLGRFFSVSYLFYTVGRTPWPGNQPVARLLPTHRTKQTPNKRTETSLP